MPLTLDTFCQALAQSQLLTSEELRQVDRLRHLVEQEGGSLERLPAWLVTHHYLTPFQVRRLLDGHTSHFFLGRYKLLAQLGQGTMARVYKAVCPNGDLFAVKVLTPSRAHDPRWRPLFELEAQEASRFRHPNIVRTFEAGWADGLRYLVMEYLEGETLADVLQRRRRLAPAEAVRIAYQTLQGMDHLHQQKATHCNLEPAHLMLVPPCGQPDTTLESTVKILGAGLGRPLFGVAVQDAEKKIEDVGEVTLHGQVDYLAPELAGLPERADIRADLYSLGCILYHCLAGQPPYPVGSTFDKLLRHATEPPPSLVAINHEVAEGLQLVVGRLMAREPAQRYPDPGAAARALVAFLPPERTLAQVPLALPVEVPVAGFAAAVEDQAAPHAR